LRICHRQSQGHSTILSPREPWTPRLLWSAITEHSDHVRPPPDSQDVLSTLDAQGLDFPGANLSGLELLGAVLIEATLNGVSLVGTDLSGARLNGATLRGANLSHSNLRKAQGRQFDAQGRAFCGAVLDRSEFEEAGFRHADLSKARFGRAMLYGVDLRDADLRECAFGHDIRSTALTNVRIAGCRVEGATGTVDGPADVGAQATQLLDGAELQQWFVDHGAPLVEVMHQR
jgi:uncharacterized protein YjbI with pentapeptide repeats